MASLPFLGAWIPSVLVPKGSINHGGRKMLVKGQGEGREQQVSAEVSTSVFIIQTAVTLYLTAYENMPSSPS